MESIKNNVSWDSSYGLNGSPKKVYVRNLIFKCRMWRGQSTKKLLACEACVLISGLIVVQSTGLLP